MMSSPTSPMPDLFQILPANKSEPCQPDAGGVTPTLATFRTVVDVYLVSALCVAGLIGNSLSIAVLQRDRDKPNTTNWLLQTLAAVDMVYLLASGVIQPLKTIYDMGDWAAAAAATAGTSNGGGVTEVVPGRTSELPRTSVSWFRIVYPYIEAHAWVIASIAQTTTVWLVMLVTVDRYVAVCLPMKSEWRSLKRAQMAMAVVVLTAILYNIPRFLEREVIWQTRCDDGLVRPVIKWTLFRRNNIYFLVYKTVCYFVFRAVGPLTALVILNSRLIRALSRVRRRRMKMLGKPASTAAAASLKTPKNGKARAASASKHHENLTLMLVTVVTVFIVCQLPAVSIRIAATANEFSPSSVRLEKTALRYANVTCNALLTLNSAVNFLVYCLVGKKFRRILFQEMCYPCCRRFPVLRLCWRSCASDDHLAGVSGANGGGGSLERTRTGTDLPKTVTAPCKTKQKNDDRTATEEGVLSQEQETAIVSSL